MDYLTSPDCLRVGAFLQHHALLHLHSISWSSVLKVRYIYHIEHFVFVCLCLCSIAIFKYRCTFLAVFSFTSCHFPSRLVSNRIYHASNVLSLFHELGTRYESVSIAFSLLLIFDKW